MSEKAKPFIADATAKKVFMKVAAQDHCDTDCGDYHRDRLLISLGRVYTKEEMDRDREEILNWFAKQPKP